MVDGPPHRFTTVASWRGAYGAPELDGKTFGSKAHEFRRYVDLPERVEGTFEIALAIDQADHRDRQLFTDHHWLVVSPHEVAGTPDAIRAYIQTSGAEFSVAQGVYVETRSGWFSDRTARYLASGKPALVQETGSSLPTGEGLITFRSPEEAAAGAAKIADNYAAHSRAARTLAREYLGYEPILVDLLERAMP